MRLGIRQREETEEEPPRRPWQVWILSESVMQSIVAAAHAWRVSKMVMRCAATSWAWRYEFDYGIPRMAHTLVELETLGRTSRL
jgi:hypothetical protein